MYLVVFGSLGLGKVLFWFLVTLVLLSVGGTCEERFPSEGGIASSHSEGEEALRKSVQGVSPVSIFETPWTFDFCQSQLVNSKSATSWNTSSSFGRR